MRGIVKLLFGDSAGIDGEAGRALARLAGNDSERDMTERVLRSGEWCGSTPGRAPAGRGGPAARRLGRLGPDAVISESD